MNRATSFDFEGKAKKNWIDTKYELPKLTIAFNISINIL